MNDLILGIETSCDDTSIALVAQDGQVVACETVSQYEIHAEFGGIYPELASRAHLEAILPTLDKTLAVIDGDLDRIRALAVTRGPGLIGSLLVGVNTAQALGIGWNKPVIGVNHLQGHLRSPALEGQELPYPAIIMLVSGGHTLIAYAEGPQKADLLGTTRDDSVGETYDKVARMLGFGMPGGPAIDKAAKLGETRYKFPAPMKNQGYEFSFSGLKSSIARFIDQNPDAETNDIAASFVKSCLDVLQAKLARALAAYEPTSLVLVGGVAASPQVRSMVEGLCQEAGVRACLPSLKWATDNGAMIAMAAWDKINAPLETDFSVIPNLPLNQV